MRGFGIEDDMAAFFSIFAPFVGMALDTYRLFA
jgi:hypothetical protein